MGTIWSPNAQTSVKQLNSSTSSASSLTNNSITNVTGRNMHISTSQGTSNSTGLPQTNRGRYNIAGMKPILVQSSKISNMKDGISLCFSLSKCNWHVRFHMHVCLVLIHLVLCKDVKHEIFIKLPTSAVFHVSFGF